MLFKVGDLVKLKKDNDYSNWGHSPNKEAIYKLFEGNYKGDFSISQRHSSNDAHWFGNKKFLNKWFEKYDERITSWRDRLGQTN